jgi:hypothetical protein
MTPAVMDWNSILVENLVVDHESVRAFERIRVLLALERKRRAHRRAAQRCTLARCSPRRAARHPKNPAIAKPLAAHSAPLHCHGRQGALAPQQYSVPKCRNKYDQRHRSYCDRRGEE